VLPPGGSFDPSTDKIFVFSVGNFEPFGAMMLINGSPQPRPLRLPAGRKYRFRLIQISPGFPSMRVSLTQAGKPAEWRAIAKDGAELPPSQAVMRSASLTVTTGETYDFEYDAQAPQELGLELYLPGPKWRTTQAIVFGTPSPRRP